MVPFQALPQAMETRDDDEEDDHMQDVQHIPPAPSVVALLPFRLACWSHWFRSHMGLWQI